MQSDRPDHTEESDGRCCPACGGTDTVLVREGDHETVTPKTADFIGCKSCNEMWSVDQSPDRLFVPLKTEHYRNFESGDKTWELRGVNDQFHLGTVREGRRVELRRGYSTPDSLWGTIADVELFDSLASIPTELRWEIVPDATREEFVENAEEMLGKYDRFIAFKVEVEHGE